MDVKVGSSEPLVERLLTAYSEEGPFQIQPGHELPTFKEVRAVVAILRELLFPGYGGEPHRSGAAFRASVTAHLAEAQMRLMRQVFRGLHFRCGRSGHECSFCEERAEEITTTFLDDLPFLRAQLLVDVCATYEGDPAASGPDEVMFAYPGPLAITAYRIAHRLHELGAVIVPRMMTEGAHVETGIDIHPGAVIGPALVIDHGSGVVVGETSVVGARVRIYQGVTLGALSLPAGETRNLASQKRHPTIEDDVIIYANATILGGNTIVGKGAVIGGNAFVTESVPPGARRL